MAVEQDAAVGQAGVGQNVAGGQDAAVGQAVVHQEPGCGGSGVRCKNSSADITSQTIYKRASKSNKIGRGNSIEDICLLVSTFSIRYYCHIR